jgi:hypothetical protein
MSESQLAINSPEAWSIPNCLAAPRLPLNLKTCVAYLFAISIVLSVEPPSIIIISIDGYICMTILFRHFSNVRSLFNVGIMNETFGNSKFSVLFLADRSIV